MKFVFMCSKKFSNRNIIEILISDFKSKTNLTKTEWESLVYTVCPMYIWFTSGLPSSLSQWALDTTLRRVLGALQMLAKGRRSVLYSTTRTSSAWPDPTTTRCSVAVGHPGCHSLTHSGSPLFRCLDWSQSRRAGLSTLHPLWNN